MQPILLNSNRSDGQKPSRDYSPTKDGQAQPSASCATSGGGYRNSFSCGQSQRNYISAIATVGEVLDNAGALGAGESMLGERGEEVSVGMQLGRCSRPCPRRYLQLLAHDFWNVLHL